MVVLVVVLLVLGPPITAILSRAYTGSNPGVAFVVGNGDIDSSNGFEHSMHLWGFDWFKLDWLVNRELAIYAVCIAAVWQGAGFVLGPLFQW